MPFIAERMKDFSDDSRLMLLMMMADGVEAGGRALLALCRRAGRRQRMTQRLLDLERGGWIARVQPSGKLDARQWRITERAVQSMQGEVDPEVAWARPWDGLWRVVLFDVPQAQAKLRTRLRRALQSRRFGWLQNSVWLSPDPITAETLQLEKHRVSVENLVVIAGRPATGESDAELVAGAWDFSGLARLHAAYLKLLRLRPAGGRDARLADWATWAAAEQRAWREIVRHDPFLPEPLLPSDYAGRSAWRARQEALRAAGQAVGQIAVREP